MNRTLVILSSIFLISLVLGLFTLFLVKPVNAIPSGANVTFINSSTAQSDAPTSYSALAGNMTELSVFGYSSTQTWQGYFGNVSGTIQLADGSDKVMYNWSETSPDGEVFASRNSSITWTSVACFNMSNVSGMNKTILETMYGLELDDADGVDETFNLNNHPQFGIGAVSFTTGVCNNTRLFNESGIGHFNEVLLYEPTTASIIFASILEDNANGYDGRTHDFEMLVLENGHAGDVTTTPYYFYVELG